LQDRFAEEIPVFFESELGSLSQAIDARVQEVLSPYQDQAGRLIETVRRAAAELFAVPYRAPDSTRALERTHKPYWVMQNWGTLISPIPENLFDRFLPGAVRRRRIKKRLAEDIETLAVRNVENVRWATLQNLEDAFRRFGSELDDRLKEIIDATRGAIESAHLRRRGSLATIEPELQRLKDTESALAEMDEALAKFAASGGEND
jgi:hypothetical protein